MNNKKVDGYAGYHKVPSVTLVGCWAHARHKFDEAFKSIAFFEANDVGCSAMEGLHYCNQLYRIERDLKELSPIERYEKSLECSKRVLNAFLSWLKIQEQKVLPKSALGQAITYCLNQ